MSNGEVISVIFLLSVVALVLWIAFVFVRGTFRFIREILWQITGFAGLAKKITIDGNEYVDPYWLRDLSQKRITNYIENLSDDGRDAYSAYLSSRQSSSDNYEEECSEEYSAPAARETSAPRRARVKYTIYRRVPNGYEYTYSSGYDNAQVAVGYAKEAKRKNPNDFIRVSGSDGSTVWTA
jgi:hypothetical protein